MKQDAVITGFASRVKQVRPQSLIIFGALKSCGVNRKQRLPISIIRDEDRKLRDSSICIEETDFREEAIRLHDFEDPFRSSRLLTTSRLLLLARSRRTLNIINGIFQLYFCKYTFYDISGYVSIILYFRELVKLCRAAVAWSIECLPGRT